MDHDEEIKNLKHRIARLEGGLRVFADLGRSLKIVKDATKFGGISVAGESARSSVCWFDFERAADALYGEHDQ